MRYYQRLALLPTSDPGNSTFRMYPLELVDRIRFIKRSHELGFSLEEIGTFLRLEDGTNRKAIRKVANDRLDDIRAKIVDLQRMEHVLSRLVHECETTGIAIPCPIVAALAEGGAIKPPSYS